jgi:hypothetical protein
MILKLKYQLNSILTIIFVSTFLTINAQNTNASFTFKQISETEFKTKFKKNFNATPIQTVDPSILENALQIIDRSYTQQEIELAANELCKSPRCLTKFHGYYPNLDILIFLIQDYHFENAVFIKNNKNFPKKCINRFNGTYGVMSKSGFWFGLERQDNDNYLQVEICQITEKGAWSIIKFDFKEIDINNNEKEPIFWVDKNTIYIATIEFNNTKEEEKFYEIKFNY